MGVLRSCRANRWGLEPWSTASTFQLRTDIFLGPIFSWENASGFRIILWIWAWQLKTQKCRRYWSSDLGQHAFLLRVSPPKKRIDLSQSCLYLYKDQPFCLWKPPKKAAIFCRFPSHPVFHCQHFRLPTCWPTPNEHWGDSSHQWRAGRSPGKNGALKSSQLINTGLVTKIVA